MNDKNYYNETYSGIFDEVYRQLMMSSFFPPTTAEIIALNILTELDGNLDLNDKPLILKQVDKYLEAVVKFK